LGWPDYGLPKDMDLMIKLIGLACDAVKQKKEEKIMMHCSAGVGRTGTLIALVNLTSEAKGAGKEKKLSVFRTVRKLRDQRIHMVERLVPLIIIE
jgi:protein tyrosine phosphatase